MGDPILPMLDPETLAQKAAGFIAKGEQRNQADFAAADFNQATAYALMALLTEVHKLRESIGRLEASRD
jgi:hypothetical protein